MAANIDKILNLPKLSQHEKEQLQQWQNASYAQRLAWLEDAQKIVSNNIARNKATR